MRPCILPWYQTSQGESFLHWLSPIPLLFCLNHIPIKLTHLLLKWNCSGQGNIFISISKSSGCLTVLSSVDLSVILDRVDHSLLLEVLSFLVYYSGFARETKPSWHIYTGIQDNTFLVVLWPPQSPLAGSLPLLVTSWHWPALELNPLVPLSSLPILIPLVMVSNIVSLYAVYTIKGIPRDRKFLFYLTPILQLLIFCVFLALLFSLLPSLWLSLSSLLPFLLLKRTVYRYIYIQIVSKLFEIKL